MATLHHGMVGQKVQGAFFQSDPIDQVQLQDFRIEWLGVIK